MMRVHRSERVGQCLGAALADVPDPQAVDQTPQLAILAALDLADEIRRRLLAHPFERRQLIGSETVDVRIARHKAVGNQPRDQRFSQPFDVHSVARREMLEARAAASPDTTCSRSATPLRLSARTSSRWHRGQCLGISQRAERPDRPGHNTNDLGNDVARLFDDDAIAVADVLPRHLVRVVQGRHRHGRPGDEDRLQNGERRDGAGAADVDVDLLMRVVSACSGGNLKAMAHRGNFDVVPSRPRRAMSSSLTTTPSVSNGSTRAAVDRFSLHSLQYSITSSMPVSALPVGLHRQPPSLEVLQKLARASAAAIRCRPADTGTRAVPAS